MTFGVDGLFGAFVYASNGSNLAIAYRHIGPILWVNRAIHDTAVFDH